MNLCSVRSESREIDHVVDKLSFINEVEGTSVFQPAPDLFFVSLSGLQFLGLSLVLLPCMHILTQLLAYYFCNTI